jgi:hypothetical protein
MMPNGPVGRKLQHFECTSKASVNANVRARGPIYMGLQRTPICLRGALESCFGVYDCRGFGFCCGRFDQKLAAQRLFPSLGYALVIGVVGCRGPLDARRGAKSFGLFAIQRNSDRKIVFWASVS